MEQRTYHNGGTNPEALGSAIVAHFSKDAHYRAQTVGHGDSLIVQVGRVSHLDHPTLTLAIHRAEDNLYDTVITMGEQEWLATERLEYGVLSGLAALLFKPWAMFALLWPIVHLSDHEILPDAVWAQVEQFFSANGGELANTQTISHPHLGQSEDQPEDSAEEAESDAFPS